MKKPNGVPPGVLYDKEDEGIVSGYHWRFAANGYLITQLKRTVNGKKMVTTLFLHRIIANPPPGMVVDHINGNKSDVRRENLRSVSVSENGQNRIRRNAANKTGYRGVWYDASRGNFTAKATVNKKTHFLGRFDTAEMANEAAEHFRRSHMPGYIDHGDLGV